MLFLDFTSACNTIVPNKLLKDLSRYYWVLVSTLASPFLTSQTRKVKLEKGLSSRSGIKCGVSQGGQLSALLFTLYTDEIKFDDHVSVTKYADDTALSCQISKDSFN